jgi:hypothetical protein
LRASVLLTLALLTTGLTGRCTAREPGPAEPAANPLAAYVNSHPRPEFVIEEHLPPDAKLGVYNGKR